MIYCPYTNKNLAKEETNSDHIIPLSLGGINGFEIPTCKEFNSRVGSKIDGKVVNGFLIQMKRNKLKIRGHSGKVPKVYFKNAKDIETGLSIQVTIDRESGLKVNVPYVPQNKKFPTGNVIGFSAKMEIDIWLQFVAKVALGTGYYVYGDLFINNAEHSELRIIMNNKPNEIGDKIYNIKTTVHDFLQGKGCQQIETFRYICSVVGDNSCVGLVPSSKSVTIFVGVLGQYIGMVNVPANTSSFPNNRNFHWGHFICPQEGKLKRVSFYKVLEKVAKRE